MHGTVAAFTTDVACIPTAYSRKFKGLFNSVGYQAVVDLQETDTKDAVKNTIRYIQDYKNLQEQVHECNRNWKGKSDKIKDVIQRWIVEKRK